MLSRETQGGICIEEEQKRAGAVALDDTKHCSRDHSTMHVLSDAQV